MDGSIEPIAEQARQVCPSTRSNGNLGNRAYVQGGELHQGIGHLPMMTVMNCIVDEHNPVLIVVAANALKAEP